MLVFTSQFISTHCKIGLIFPKKCFRSNYNILFIFLNLRHFSEVFACLYFYKLISLVLHADNSYLATGYPITCCGVVESWAVLIKTANPVTIYFQIWRPSTGTTYTLVGENQFCKCEHVLCVHVFYCFSLCVQLGIFKAIQNVLILCQCT